MCFEYLPRLISFVSSFSIDKGELFTWGTCGETGRLGHGDFGHCFEPKRVKWPQEQHGQRVHVHKVALGQDGGLAVVELDS